MEHWQRLQPLKVKGGERHPKSAKEKLRRVGAVVLGRMELLAYCMAPMKSLARKSTLETSSRPKKRLSRSSRYSSRPNREQTT